MISRRQIIESQQKLNAQRYLLEKQQQQSKQIQKQQNSMNNVTTRPQNYKQLSATKMAKPEEAGAPKNATNKTRQLGKIKQFSIGQQEYDMKLARDIRRFNKCFHDDDHHHEDIGEDNDDDGEISHEKDVQEGDDVDEDDEDDEDDFRAQDVHEQRNSNDMHEDYRHFDPYSVYGEEDEEEDVWYSEERLFEDHIQEIIDKWLAIDDEIWAKIICMERNRRIAKAYARKHSLTVNGSKDEYLDGTTLGLNSFENQDRDTKTRHIKQYIGQGLRIKITQNGDILVKRLSKANVFVHQIDHKSFGISERLKGSSSDLYALNSESGDLYGIVGPLSRSQTNYTSSFTGEALSMANKTTFREIQSNQSNKLQQRQLVSSNSALNQRRHQLRHDHKMVPNNNSSSDASTSSSSGGIESSSSLFYREKSNANGKGNKIFTDKLLNDQQFRGLSSSSEVANHLVKNSGSIVLEYNKPMKIFDMSKFKSMLERESRLPYPNRKLLQSHCISIISFVVDDRKMLNLPSWIMIINIVAIDLLKIELGLVDPSFDGLTHSSTNINNSSILLYDPLVDRRRFGYHLSDYNNKTNSMTMSDSTMVVSSSNINNTTTMSSQQQRLNNLNHLAASKKAFANAAALGAYNGDHYNQMSNHLILNARSAVNELKAAKQQHKCQRRYLDNNNIRSEKVDTTGNTNNHDSDLELRQATSGKVGKHTESEVQQSSSSSGFNSHCSSQNDSSAASSSSNIASGLSAASDELPSETPSSSPYRVDESEEQENGVVESASALKPSMFKHLSKTSTVENKVLDEDQNSDNIKSNQAKHSCSNMTTNSGNNNNPLQCRGKRPPKLPHRIVENSNNLGMSEPIPIPAPPTSSVGGPSGKANLILVSPTGLSPPLPKRKGPQKGVVRSSSQLELTSDEHSMLPEFSTIKHIDENGKCSVVDLEQHRQINKSDPLKGKLPAGIPAHAQLAPPATQRHILRYLMSATRGNFASNSDYKGAADTNHKSSTPASPIKYQRPLPILPNQRVCQGGFSQDQQPEENLYYCGLQARVPIRRLITPHQMNIPPPLNPISKSAMNSILTDFRLNSINHNHHHHSHNQQNCRNDYLRQQYLLKNLQNSSNSHYLHQKFQKSSTGTSVTKPLMKFFKTSNGNNNTNNITNNNNHTATKDTQNSSTTSMSLSVDNIHKKANQKSSQSLLGQALKLKKSKVKQTQIERGVN